MRRVFIKLILAVLGSAAIFYYAVQTAFVVEFINRLRSRFKKIATIPEDSKREEAILLEKGKSVSVELALNSRCTCDNDNNPSLFHWGMFDTHFKLTSSQLDMILNYARIPQLNFHGANIDDHKNVFTFSIRRRYEESKHDTILIESGMQHQALCLVCATLGVGVLFKSMGKNGRILDENTHAMIRIRIDPMKPSYEGSFWTRSIPDGRRRWLRGNLPEPKRDGFVSMLDGVRQVRLERFGSRVAGNTEIGQLLWAARGRTPHLYKSKEWGMTVPTSQGMQYLTSLFFFQDTITYRYVNWKQGRPTHHLKKLDGINGLLSELIMTFPNDYNAFFVLSKNENSYRATWEVGYQLFNIILQASVLDLHYKAEILNNEQKTLFLETSIKDPMVLVMIKADPASVL